MLALEDLLAANLAARRQVVAVEALRRLLGELDGAGPRQPLAKALHERLGVPLEAAKSLHEAAQRKLRQMHEEKFAAKVRGEALVEAQALDATVRELAQGGFSARLGERLVQQKLLKEVDQRRIKQQVAQEMLDEELRIVMSNRSSQYAQTLNVQPAGGPPAGSAAPVKLTNPKAHAPSAPQPGGPQPGGPQPGGPQPGAPAGLPQVGISGEYFNMSAFGAAPGQNPAPSEEKTEKHPAVAGDGERTMDLPPGSVAGMLNTPGADAERTMDMDAPPTLPPPPGMGDGERTMDMEQLATLPPPGGGGDNLMRTVAYEGSIPMPGGPGAPGAPGGGGGDMMRTVAFDDPRAAGGSAPGAPQGPGSLSEGSLVDGRYRIERELGRGAMGVVYLAKIEPQMRPVALKCIQGVSDAEALGRFKREILVSKRLQHPNVIRVFDAGQFPDGSQFMVMEYLTGTSLEAFIAEQGAQPMARSLELFEQILEGLASVHSAQIVHRDMKPENIQIMEVDGQDVIKIVDFGIARFLDQEEVADEQGEEIFQTVKGTLSGSPMYVAPEAVMDPEQVSTSHDVYAAGVILYELLAAKKPFEEAKTLREILTNTLESRPKPLDETHPEGAPHPAALERLIRKFLEKDPDLRPATGEAGLEVLREARGELRVFRQGEGAPESGITGRLFRRITGLFGRGSP